MISEKKKPGCLKWLLIAILALVLLAVGGFIAMRELPARISQRTPEPIVDVTQLPDSGDVPADPSVTAVPGETDEPGETDAPNAGDEPGATDEPNADDEPDATEEPAAVVDWGVNTELPDDEWINILLLGTDASDPDQPGRTDTMIIASVNMLNGDLKLTSIMRDTYVPIYGHANNKITAANWFGGPDLALKTVNEAFDMNITHYAMVDFSSFAYIVDALGGVELAVTETEMKYINQLMEDMRVLYPNIELEKNDLTEYGDSVHLDGMQTLAFSRIRKLDSDYQRTSRQRQVLSAILSKLRSVRDPGTLYELFEIGINYTRTTLNPGDIAQLAMKVITNGADFEEMRLPAEGTYKTTNYKNIGDVLDPDLSKNVEILHEFIYGAE